MALDAESLIEAALLTQGEPLSEKYLRTLSTPAISADKLIDVLAMLQLRWQNRAMSLVKSAEGWRFRLDDEAMTLLSEVHEQKAPRYSRAVMETLAIIVYQQPVTRGDIEAIRGVTVSSHIIQTLQERGWIESVGQRESLGRPTLWATTMQFLSDFQLNSLHDLPPLTELGELIVPNHSLPAAENVAEEPQAMLDVRSQHENQDNQTLVP